MAKLSADLLSQVKSTGLARVTSASTVADAILAVTNRLKVATLVTAQQVLDRTAVAGVVLQGLAQANVLTGKDGTGRPHVSCRTNFFLCTQDQIKAFLAKLSLCTTVEAVQTEYYAFIDEYAINGVIWDNESGWNQRGNQSTWTGNLRADATTGDISISNLTPEKPAVVIQAKSLSAALKVGAAPAAAQTASEPAAPVMKLFNGTPMAPAALLQLGFPQAAIDALPNA